MSDDIKLIDDRRPTTDERERADVALAEVLRALLEELMTVRRRATELVER